MRGRIIMATDHISLFDHGVTLILVFGFACRLAARLDIMPQLLCMADNAYFRERRSIKPLHARMLPANATLPGSGTGAGAKVNRILSIPTQSVREPTPSIAIVKGMEPE
jgi:hypothetical protein